MGHIYPSNGSYLPIELNLKLYTVIYFYILYNCTKFHCDRLSRFCSRVSAQQQQEEEEQEEVRLRINI